MQKGEGEEKRRKRELINDDNGARKIKYQERKVRKGNQARGRIRKEKEEGR